MELTNTMNKLQINQFERLRFAELKSRLFELEKDLKDERHQLWLQEKNQNTEYQVWERLEVISTDILGYISQITLKGATRQSPRKVIEHLHSLSIFEIDCIISWYESSANNYPKIKQYFELLDYTRLLLLEYVEQNNLVSSNHYQI
jgi:hypothetical protein